jgi:hypothetical protein
MLNTNSPATNAVSAARFDVLVQAFRAFRRARIERWFMSAVALDISDMRAPPKDWWLAEVDYVQ